MRRASPRGMTLVEFLVVLVIVGAVVFTLFPVCILNSASLRRAQMTQTLSNMRQLQLETQRLAYERATNAGVGGVISPNNQPISFSQWTNGLVAGGNISATDIAKLVATPGAPIGINAFAVTEGDGGETLFLATKNWHGITSKKLSGQPYEGLGFVVFRLKGDGAILRARAVDDATAIGGGGAFNYRPLEQ